MHMITLMITADTVALSEKTREYIEKRFRGFDRFIDDRLPHEIAVTVSRATAYKREDAYRVEASFKLHERNFFATAEALEIETAADMAKEELMREVTSSNDRRRTLFHRGARKLKSLIKGMGRKS